MSPNAEGKKFVARIHPEFADEKPILTTEHLDFVKKEMAKVGVKNLLCEYNVPEGWAEFYEDEEEVEKDWMAKMDNLVKEAADEMSDPDSSEEEEDSEDYESSASESHYDDLINQLKSGKTIKLPPASSGRVLTHTFNEETGKFEVKMEKVPRFIHDDEEIERLVKKTAAEYESSKTESKVVKVEELSEDSEDSDGSEDDSEEESEETSKISQEGFNLDDVKMVFEEKARVEAEKRALELSKMPYLTTPQLLIFVLFVPIVIAFWMHQFDIDFGFFGIFDF